MPNNKRAFRTKYIHGDTERNNLPNPEVEEQTELEPYQEASRKFLKVIKEIMIILLTARNKKTAIIAICFALGLGHLTKHENITRAAKALGIHFSTLFEQVENYKGKLERAFKDEPERD